MSKFLTLICVFFIFTASEAENQGDSILVKQKRPYYHNMVASLSVSQIKPKFLSNDFQTYNWNNYDAQFKWFEFSYGYGKVNTKENGIDIVQNIHDSKVGVNWTIKKLVRGNRALDVKGFLFVPSISANFTQLKVWKFNDTRIRGLKLAPMVSFQFPFVGIDAKCNFDFRQNKSPYVKPFSIYPEIAIKFDGLFNVLNPQDIYVGRWVNKYVLGEKTQLSANTYRVDYYVFTHEFDRYAKSIGRISSFGPRYTFKNFGYAGSTKMFGIGYFFRQGALAVDAYADFGKLGFASEASNEYKVGISRDMPKRSITIYNDLFNKKNNISTGYFNAKRFGGSISIDLFNLINPLGNAGGHDANLPTSMLRSYLGFGGGYVLLSAPHYASAEGLAAANKAFEDNYLLAPVSENHAKFSKNTRYISINAGLELGVIQLKLEHCYYKHAYLASLSSITLGYMLPFKRISKAIKETKE